MLEFGACGWHSFWSRFKGIDFVNCVNVIVNIFSHLEEENSSSCLKRPAIKHGLFSNIKQTENKLSFSECNPTIKQTENIAMLGSAGPCHN